MWRCILIRLTVYQCQRYRPTNPEHVVLALALIARPVLDFAARPVIAFLLYPFKAALTLQLKMNGISNLVIA